jgi:hypothetical protein
MPRAEVDSNATFAMRVCRSRKNVRELPYFDAASHSQVPAAKDDATMTDTVEKVAERLARLETTVAEGFRDNGLRFQGIEARLDALDNKIDVSVESLRGDIKTVIEVVTALTDEWRRTADSIRKEGAADREVLKAALLDHGRRIGRLEDRVTSSSS